jgi:hypothetical protein
MKKHLKEYKKYKGQHLLKKKRLLIAFHTLNVNFLNSLYLKQVLFKFNLKYFKVHVTITKNLLKNSIFTNYSNIINNSMCLIYPENFTNMKNNIQEILNIDKKLNILSLKLNNNFYIKPQLRNITTLHYNKNIKVLNKTFKNILKTPYYKLKNKSK